MEAAAKQSKELKGGAQRGTPVLVVDTPGPAQSCGRCGRAWEPPRFGFKTATCHKCGKVGHIASACCSGQKKPQAGKRAISASSVHALWQGTLVHCAGSIVPAILSTVGGHG